LNDLVCGCVIAIDAHIALALALALARAPATPVARHGTTRLGGLLGRSGRLATMTIRRSLIITIVTIVIDGTRRSGVQSRW